jgi:squalene-hopene/tetraprenyl-beta-curcumene cyclase
MSTNRRISRRQFTIMCQIALVPAIWPMAKLLGFAVERAIDYLPEHGRSPDGPPASRDDVGVTALVATALLRCGNELRNPRVVKSLKYLEKSVQPDGGIYTPGGQRENYETCLAMICLREANADRRYDRILRNATAFVKTCQWDESKGKGRSDISYGGAGYGKHRRPDLSNTAFLLDAVGACGAGPRDSTVQKALVFVSRCQNVDRTDHATPTSQKGGFRDSCAAGGGSASCGVMTYRGLRSLLCAGVPRDDARVQDALRWIGKHYDMTSNPGMGNAGLYHYYHVCAKTLSSLGIGAIEDAAGIEHNWRDELCSEVVRRQQKDGSWANDNGVWLENDPHVATAHALLALSYCRKSFGLTV